MSGETSSEENAPMEKRKLGDALRLGKKSFGLSDDPLGFGRHARLFEQMRLGKRSETEREKKKHGGKRLQLVIFCYF